MLSQFKDYEEKIKGKWFEDKLEDLVKWGIVQGYPDETLRPDRYNGFVENCVMYHRMVMSDPQINTVNDAMLSVVDIGGGSGFWIDTNDDWFVATNAHVVFESPDGDVRNFSVYGNPGLGFAPAVASGMSAEIYKVDHRNDLAILKVEKPNYEVETPPSITNFADVEQGEQIWCLGSPFGNSWDVCNGIVRNTERATSVWLGGQRVIGIDAPINPGNSGGLAINAQGQAVGIPNAGMVGQNSFNYMIPIKFLKELMES